MSYRSDLTDGSVLKQGAEAKIYCGEFLGKPCIIKERFSKKYRHPALDLSLTQQRMKSEVRSIVRCRTHGIRTPAIYFVDLEANKIYMEHLTSSVTLRDHINKTLATTPAAAASLSALVRRVGTVLANMHQNNVIHGDLTTSNMLLDRSDENGELGSGDLVLIDFGLGYVESLAEDKAVDLYVLERAFLSTHPNTEALFAELLAGYKDACAASGGCQEIFRKLEEVRLRGRKRTMVG